MYLHLCMHVLLQVLTRRQQLALQAKDKEKEGEEKPARGGGRGRGRGGRGRGKAKAAPSKSTEPEDVPEPEPAPKDMEVEKGKPGKSKRQRAMQTPERRRLFDDDADDDMQVTPVKAAAPSSTPAAAASPPIQQEKEKPKRAAKTKAKGKAAPKKPEGEVEEGEVPEKTEGEEVKPEKASKAPRPPTENQKTWALDFLANAKNDPASWDHVTKLFESTKIPERSHGKKGVYWTYSMYWLTRRVGLLQKQCGGGSKHILSFGGGQCVHIGIPYVASLLYVAHLNYLALFLLMIRNLQFMCAYVCMHMCERYPMCIYLHICLWSFLTGHTCAHVWCFLKSGMQSSPRLMVKKNVYL